MGRGCARLMGLALLLGLALPPAVGAQTVRGVLYDAVSGSSIELGVVRLHTETGQLVTSAITGADGSFELVAPEAGGFLLTGAALGYRRTNGGIFDLEAGSEITIEFRLRPQPVALEEIIVALDRRALEHNLVASGFVRRLSTAPGHYLTPAEIEDSPARTTQDLFYNVHGLQVRPSTAWTSHLGDRVWMQSPGGGWCQPQIFIDGARLPNVDGMESLDLIIPRAQVEAVEIYRRPSEIPVEFVGMRQRLTSGTANLSPDQQLQRRTTTVESDLSGTCGALVFWTKRR